MLLSVPGGIDFRRCTGTPTWQRPLSVTSRIWWWLPRTRTTSNPNRVKILMTSGPVRSRSLGIVAVHVHHEDNVRVGLDPIFRDGINSLQTDGQCFPEMLQQLIERVPIRHQSNGIAIGHVVRCVMRLLFFAGIVFIRDRNRIAQVRHIVTWLMSPPLPLSAFHFPPMTHNS